jgi:FKBP-type peptidyl-prolyl cis-trans isomerase FklB
MKKPLIKIAVIGIAALAIIAVVFFLWRKNSHDASVLKTQKDSLSYSIGLNIGKSLQQDSIDISPEMIARAMKDLADNKPILNDDAAKQTITQYRTQQLSIVSEKNKKAGEAFLEENKKKNDVVTLPSGLQYRVITEGSGKKPRANQTVVVHYRGMTINGKEFDSSFRNGQPVSFQVDRVIKGWTEALQLMPVGSKWEIFIPPNLAYGDRGVSQLIGPNSTLIFELELLSIK